MDELEKGLKELKGFVAHRQNSNINQPDPPELSGTKILYYVKFILYNII